LAVVAAGAVFPQSLSTSYVESQSYPVLTNQYKNGEIQISLIQDGVNAPRPLRTWKLAKKLTAAQLATLQTFFYATQQGTGTPPGTVLAASQPFYFYDVFAASPIGSNYDATGVNTTGRIVCVFQAQFAYAAQIQRIEVQDMLLVEVA
jgi:hypothetical protein